MEHHNGDGGSKRTNPAAGRGAGRVFLSSDQSGLGQAGQHPDSDRACPRLGPRGLGHGNANALTLTSYRNVVGWRELRSHALCNACPTDEPRFAHDAWPLAYIYG